LSYFNSERDRLTREFFKIGGQPNVDVKVKSLKDVRQQLVELSKKQDNEDIEVIYLIDVIDCLLIWILEDDKHKAREKVSYIWDIFNSMHNFTLFDLRILTAILFSAETLEEFIIITNKALAELEKFIEHELYIVTKTHLTNNLSYMLMKAKYNNDKEYNDQLENLLIESTDTLISLSMQFNNSFFPRALIRKGILAKDNVIIYAGLSLLNTAEAKEKIEIMKSNNIFFISAKDLLFINCL